MSAKTSNLYARIEPEVKEEAESIFATLGIPEFSGTELDAELEKGYVDMKVGKTKELHTNSHLVRQPQAKAAKAR